MRWWCRRVGCEVRLPGAINREWVFAYCLPAAPNEERIEIRFSLDLDDGRSWAMVSESEGVVIWVGCSDMGRCSMVTRRSVRRQDYLEVTWVRSEQIWHVWVDEIREQRLCGIQAQRHCWQVWVELQQLKQPLNRSRFQPGAFNKYVVLSIVLVEWRGWEFPLFKAMLVAIEVGRYKK